MAWVGILSHQVVITGRKREGGEPHQVAGRVMGCGPAGRHVRRRDVERIVVVAEIVFRNRYEVAQAVRGERRLISGIVVMTTLAVAMLVGTRVFVVAGAKGNVDVRSGLVTGRCALPVGVTERC
ncbi:hypothetical protein BH11PLA2_BH11PLA2_48770 [soil metagenome]